MMIHAATDEESSLFGIETSERYEGFYTSIGFHPECMDKLPEDYERVLEELYVRASSVHKLVAVGEIGLDYHYEGFDREKQLRVFETQLRFALKRSLPVIVHCREATEDCMKLLCAYRPEGVVHCFSGSAETAEEIVRLGMYIGFTGALAFKNSKKAKRACAAVPIQRLLLETDCPYMAPPPYRGQRCDSSMIEETAKAMAEIKGTSAQEIIEITGENACTLFGIKRNTED